MSFFDSLFGPKKPEDVLEKRQVWLSKMHGELGQQKNRLYDQLAAAQNKVISGVRQGASQGELDQANREVQRLQGEIQKVDARLGNLNEEAVKAYP